MPSRVIEPVAVIGAAGYVGRFLLKRLRDLGHPVVAVVRARSAFMVQGPGVEVLPLATVDGSRRFQRVVNLAYATGWPAFRRPRENREIAALVGRLAGPGAHVVHVSSLAVFGYALDVPIVLGPVRAGRDVEYVESKRWMESRLSAILTNQSLDIVRLGNVWGPGSPNWVVGLVERLRCGKPLLVNGTTGASNMTDVENVSSYIGHLLDLEPGGSGSSRYHHIAEFSKRPWSDSIGFLGRELALEPVSVRVPAIARDTGGMAGELKSALRTIASGIFTAAGGLKESRRCGSYIRQILDAVPDSGIDFLRRMRGGGGAASSGIAAGTEEFLSVLNPQQEFVSRTVTGWIPPISYEESLKRVSSWLKEAGYR